MEFWATCRCCKACCRTIIPLWPICRSGTSALATLAAFARPIADHGLPGAEAQTTAALESIRAIARKHGMTTSELALKWAFAGDGITSSLCGARNLAQLQSNIMAASEPLPREIIAELNRATAPLSEELGPSFDYYENPSNDRTK